jgi:eukaryotic-like serine/threonine-protein kinase
MADVQGFWQTFFRRPRRPLQGVEPRFGLSISTQIDTSVLPELSGELRGFYLLRSCAETAYSSVHLARVAGTGEEVALKVIRFQDNILDRDRFLREATAAGRLQHPSIVRMLAAGILQHENETCGWMAMEWVPGSDLARYTQRDRLLPEALVLRMGAAIAEALDHAHRAGLVHRDIKPANLLFDPTAGLVKISDFGCVHLKDADRSRTGVMLGTVAYMAPEQLTGVPVDGRADLYALGTVLFELLTGRRPFEQASMGELLTAVANEPATSLLQVRPDLPPVLGDVLSRLLSKSPAHRHRCGLDLAHELRLLVPSCAKSLPGTASIPSSTSLPAALAADGIQFRVTAS